MRTFISYFWLLNLKLSNPNRYNELYFIKIQELTPGLAQFQILGLFSNWDVVPLNWQKRRNRQAFALVPKFLGRKKSVIEIKN